MKTRLEVLIASTLFFLCLAGIVRADAPSITSWGSITQPAQGIFAGQIKGNLVYIGGFHWAPNASDADNNKVKQNPNDQYLRTIQILSRRSDGSVATTQSNTLLPEGAAFGTTVVMPNGLAILGGRNHSGPVSRCYHVHWSQDKQDLELESLPPLPFTIEKAAGDFHRGRIWLCGADPDGNSILLSLAAKTNAASSNSWKKHAPPPGMGRKDAAATVGNDSRGKALFLFGGILPDGTAAQPQVCVFHFDDETWTEPKIAFPPTFCVAGATLFRSGTIHLILTGGMDPKSQTPCAARTIWAYNTITNQLFPLTRLAATPFNIPAVQIGNHIMLPVEKASSPGAAELLALLPGKKSHRFGYLNLGLFATYFLFLTWMGWTFLKRMKEADDFFRAGHRIPWWAVGISIYGTITSAITYITVPAKSFMTDWKLLLLGVGPLIAVPILSRWYIPRLAKFDFTSAYEYLEYRFHPFVRFLGSLTFIIFQISRIAILLFLPAIAFHSISGIEMTHCILLVGITGILCTLAGGIEIVIWIEVFQVLILLVGFVLTLAVIVFRYDGSPLDMLRVAYENGKMHCIEPALNLRIDSVWTILMAAFFLYLIPYASDQTILQRYFTGKNTSERQRGVWISAGLAIPNIILLFLLGTMFYVFYRAQPEALPIDLANNDALMPLFFFTQLPDGISGVLLLALMTSAISSVSSGINAIAAAYTIDFHERLFHFSKTHAVHVARMVTLVAGTLGIGGALVLATWDITSLWDQYNLFIGLISSGLAGLFLLGIFTKRANTPGIVLGAIASGFIQFWLVKNAAVHFLLYSGTGVVTTMLFGYLASLPFAPWAKVLNASDQPASE